MPSKFELYWPAIFVVNLARRRDRWEHFNGEMKKIGVPTVFRLEGFEVVGRDGKPDGNRGCTASHRSLLDAICFHQIKRALIFEDDAMIVPENFHEVWDDIEPRIPQDWDMLYLGGHYAEDPIARVNPNIIRCGRMKTTSSYGITLQMARKMAPEIFGVGPVDELFGGFADDRANHFYCLQPRLFAQYPNVSDIQGRHMDNSMCMLDRRHESLMPRDYVGLLKDYVRPPPVLRAGKLRNPDQDKPR